MTALSVVVPVRNRAHCVVRTLESIAASTLLPAQLIIVDNGSTDDSLAVCREWAGRQAAGGMDISVLSEPRHGANAARNRGLAECRTAYVAFFDSDDLFDASFVADVSACVAAGKGTSDLLFLPSCQAIEGRLQRRYYRESADPAVHVLTSMLSTQSMVFRTAWLREIGGWDERLGVWQDWELGLRALLHAPRIQWLTARAYHRVLIHPDSITGGSFAQTWEGTLAAMQVAMERTSGREPLHVRTRIALRLRAMIMAGYMQREHCAEGVAAYQELASRCVVHPAKPLWWVGRMLFRYVALGGRGGWRIALFFLDNVL